MEWPIVTTLFSWNIPRHNFLFTETFRVTTFFYWDIPRHTFIFTEAFDAHFEKMLRHTNYKSGAELQRQMVMS